MYRMSSIRKGGTEKLTVVGSGRGKHWEGSTGLLPAVLVAIKVLFVRISKGRVYRLGERKRKA